MRKLRLQLIAILILTALLPALPAAWTVRTLFRLSLDPLLEEGIIEGAQAGLDATRDVLQAEKRRFVETLAGRVAPADGGMGWTVIDTLNTARLGALDPRERSALQAWRRAAEPVDPAGRGVQVLIPPERLPLAGEDRLVAYVMGAGGEPVWVTAALPPGLAARAGKLSDSIRLVQTLRHERGTVIRSLLATFLVVYGVILLLILVVGLLLASRLTRPLAALGGGIDAVAAGDLNTRVVDPAGGAIGKLLDNFNRMVERLGTQQTELVRLEKLGAWRQMARRLAHEIKNPLTPIQLAAQEIRDRLARDDPDYRRLVEEGTTIIEEEVQGLRSMVNEFSQFARLPEPQMSRVELAELLAEVAGLYGADRVQVRPGQVGPGQLRPGQVCPGQVHAESDSDPHLTATGAGEVWCDRQQIHRVLINLVTNALAAQEETGRTEAIELTASAASAASAAASATASAASAAAGRLGSEADTGAEAAIEIRVADRGPGVPAADRERIFEPDVTTRSDGMGLGLAIALGTVQSHGGSITVTDRAGGGALFIVRLPGRTPEQHGRSA